MRATYVVSILASSLLVCSCIPEFCADGIVNVDPVFGVEECDDGENVNGDGCSNICRIERCGDGFVNNEIEGSPTEVCDDGNDIDTDDCPSTCEIARCGDGFVLSGLEECDDANDIDNDGCSTDCLRSIEAIAAGDFHTCTLLETGVVRCWGFGGSGGLGYGNTNNIGDDEAPITAGDVNVGGIVTRIAAGNNNTCALLDTGTVRCWGNAGSGALGYGNTNNIGNDEAPITAGDVNVGSTVIQIDTDGEHTCALLDTGTVRCWGFGGNGELGYGNTTTIGDNETPDSVGDVNVGSTVTQIATGNDHTCALLSVGFVRCWGSGLVGQLGYGNTNDVGDDETPATVGNVDVGGKVIQIAAGGTHTCALLDTGAVRCWGLGLSGQLGYGNINSIGDDETPATAGDVNVGGTTIQIVAGGTHTCALIDTGTVRCWGKGVGGRLGYGNTNDIGDDETPATAGDVDVGGSVTQITAGDFHTCALLDTGAIRCWGNGNVGQLGYGNTNNTGDDEVPSSAGDVQVF